MIHFMMAFSVSSFAGLQHVIVHQFGLVEAEASPETGYYISYMFLVVNLGNGFGCIYFGRFLDRYPQIKVLKVYLLVFGVLSMLMMAMPNYTLFLIVYFFQACFYHTLSLQRGCYRYFGNKQVVKRLGKQIELVGNFALIMSVYLGI